MAETLGAAHRVETLLNMAVVLAFPWSGKRDLLHFHGSLTALPRKSSLKKTWKRGPLKGYDCCQGDRRGEGEAQAPLSTVKPSWLSGGSGERGRKGNPRQEVYTFTQHLTGCIHHSDRLQTFLLPSAGPKFLCVGFSWGNVYSVHLSGLSPE